MNKAKCHGCEGTGWVTASEKAQVCPICKGAGDIEKEDVIPKRKVGYDQDAIWKRISEDIPATVFDVIDSEVKKLGDLNRKCIIHLMIDGQLSPHGNLLFYHMTMSTITQGVSSKVSEDLMEAKNYDLLDAGIVRTIQGIPVSKHYRKFELWGVDRMSSSGLKSPIFLDPNRKGNPLFIDGGIMAFGAEFRDDVTQEQIRGALITLIGELQSTIIYGGDTLPFTGRVLNLQITPVDADFWHKNVDKSGSPSPESKVRDD